MGLVRRRLPFLSAPMLRYDRLSVSIKPDRRLSLFLPFFLPPLPSLQRRSVGPRGGTIRRAGERTGRKNTQDTKGPEVR